MATKGIGFENNERISANWEKEDLKASLRLSAEVPLKGKQKIYDHFVYYFIADSEIFWNNFDVYFFWKCYAAIYIVEKRKKLKLNLTEKPWKDQL